MYNVVESYVRLLMQVDVMSSVHCNFYFLSSRVPPASRPLFPTLILADIEHQSHQPHPFRLLTSDLIHHGSAQALARRV